MRLLVQPFGITNQGIEMQVLIPGAGGVGGYFGARIHCAGGDVTFLVRQARADYLRANGLHILSPLHDMHVSPKVITAESVSISDKFDVVILSYKAYDLAAAIDSVALVLAPHGIVIPYLNKLHRLVIGSRTEVVSSLIEPLAKILRSSDLTFNQSINMRPLHDTVKHPRFGQFPFLKFKYT